MISYSDIVWTISAGKRIIFASTRGAELIAPADIRFNGDQYIEATFDPIYNFNIVGTKKLAEIVDKARINEGYKPMIGDNNEENCEYIFDLIWNKSDDRACIAALVWNSEDEDNGKYWIIELSNYEKEHVLRMIKELMERTDKW